MRTARVWRQIAVVVMIAFALAWMFAESPQTRQPPAALHGELDLSKWRFASDGIVRLKGDWEWSWQQLLTPEQMRAEAAAGRLSVIRLPSSWNSGDGDRLYPAEGCATFRLRIRFHDAPRMLAIRVQAAATSYRIWADGVPLGGLGQVGTKRDAIVPDVAPRTYFIPTQPDGMEIVIQAANAEYRQGGLREPIELGMPEQIYGTHQRKLALDLMLFGSLFMMAVYHLLLYAVRRKDRSTLYFGAFCLFVAVRTTLVGELFFDNLFPELPWALRLRFEYVTTFVGLPIFALFMRELYPREMSRLAIRLMLASSSVYMIVMFVAPPSVFTRTIPSYHVVILLGVVYLISVFVRAVRHGRHGALLSSIGGLVYAVSVVNDILYSDEFIRTGSYSPLGLIVFVLLHSTVLSMKFTRALASEQSMTQQLALQAKEVRMLNDRLQELNRGLEEGIARRTKQLKQSNESLARKAAEFVRMDASRRQLLSDISHELRTPMTSIRGYVEAILDKVFVSPEEQRHYLKLILNKMIGLNRLITDLFELSKLESGQQDLHFHSVPLAAFLRKTRQRHELDVAHNGLRFVWDESGLDAVSSGACVILDPERVDQVLTNLVSNAIQYTLPGGDIRFRFAAREGQRNGEPVRELVVQVADTGRGIAEQDLPFIFERFYRGREPAAGGSGIGLAIAKEIVTQHGGKIWAQSRKGEGSTFCFTLLLYEETE